MAGGPYAKAVACWRCAEQADRTYEGVENDLYRCNVCGYEFGIDFDNSGLPERPLWPPTPEERAAILQRRRS